MRSPIALTIAVLVAAWGAAAAAHAAPFYSVPVWIAQPANDATVRNVSGNLRVAVALAEPLKVSSGDYVQLVVDGGVVGDASDGQHFRLLDLPRGRHTLEADVRDSHGDVLMRSAPVLVDMALPRG